MKIAEKQIVEKIAKDEHLYYLDLLIMYIKAKRIVNINVLIKNDFDFFVSLVRHKKIKGTI